MRSTRRLGIAVFGVAVIWIQLGSGAAFAAPRAAGDPDSTFGTNGVTTQSFGTGGSSWYAMTMQPDGKLVLGGYGDFGNGHSDVAVARFSKDGVVDTSFGGGDGVAEANFGADANANRVTVLADGSIVAGGGVYGSADDFAIAKFTPSGMLDPAFGTGGMVTTDFGGNNDSVWGVVPAGSGDLIAFGNANPGGANRAALVAYQPNGQLDASFGTSGTVMQDIGSNAFIEAGAIGQDGSLFAVGGTGASNDFAVVKFSAEGVLDATYGTGGVAVADFNGQADLADAVSVAADGSALLGGYATDASGSASSMALARFRPDGSLDPSFGTGGIAGEHVGASFARIQDLAVQPDGKILAAGWSLAAGSNRQTTLARFGSSGALDTSFGTGGFVTNDVTPAGDQWYGVAVQSSGRVVVGGFVNGQTQAGVAGYVGGVGPSCTVVGTPGRDPYMRGSEGRSVVCGLGGNDTLRSSVGDDYLFGGPGTDTALYLGAGGPVQADLGRGKASGEGSDLLFSIENLTGTSYDDKLSGSGAKNKLTGSGGNDRLAGRGGNDRLIGGAGDDVLNGGPGTDTCKQGPGYGSSVHCEHS